MKRAFNFVPASTPIAMALAGVAIACFSSQPAQAESRSVKRNFVASESVVYTDLDLTRESDAQVMIGRIKEAAFRVCGGDPRDHVGYDLMPGRIELAFKECRADAVERAIATVGVPQLTAAAR
jgi:UrcA family protein